METKAKTRDKPRERQGEETATSTDLTGQVFGKLTVLWKYKESNNGGASWVCRCSCGHLDIISGSKLKSGHNTHCAYCNMGRFVFHDHFQTVECILPGGAGFRFDFEDFPKVIKYKWNHMKNGYFKASLGSREKGHILLHRLLMEPPSNMVVDHIDGDPSNCKRNNMRICTPAENSRNSSLNKNNLSGFKGVYYDKRRKRWYARIYKEKSYGLGGYDTAEEAARAYDDAAQKLHREFAKTNETLQIIGGGNL